MSFDEVQVFLSSVRKDVQNPRIHSYWPVWVAYRHVAQAVVLTLLSDILYTGENQARRLQ